MRRDRLSANWLAIGIVILLLAALASKSLLISVPPARSVPGEFDAHRAKSRLAFILGDQRPHPADSDADDMVRARLVVTLRQSGFDPIVRDQFACNDFQKNRLVACTRTHNVIATFGPKAGKALLLSAHYDSVPVGPGASDDGIGVATLLEVGSILKDRPLQRPVILLFNEGEELGLIGARAFLADPLSRNVDTLLNFEARGVNGPVTMFETNQPNGQAIAAYASSVKRPFASSLSTDVARLIPNDTDVTTYKERGWVTLNSAITGNETRYHSPGDDLAGLDLRSLQDMGDEALALASRLSAAPPRAEGNRIFFDLTQRFFIQIPLLVGVVLLLVLLIGFASIAWARGRAARGSAAVLAALVVAGVSAWLALTIVTALRAGIFWRTYGEISFLAIYATIVVAELAIFRTLGARLETRQLRGAYWFLFLLIGGALAVIAPGAIIYFLLPPAIVLLGIAASKWYRPAETIGALLGLALLYLTWSELLAELEELFSPGPLWVVAPIAAIMIAPALIEANPIFSSASRRIVLFAAAFIALCGWGAAGIAPAYSKDHQQRFTIEHLSLFPSARTYWSILNDGASLPHAYDRLGTWHLGKLPFSERRRWFSPAPPAPGVQAPAIQVLETLRNGDERRLRLRLKSNGAERILLIAPEDAYIRTAGAAGFIRPISGEDSSGKFTISCTGRSCDGAELMIDLNNPKPVVFTIVGARNGLPASADSLVAARPPFARPQYTPDETLAVSRVSL